MLLLFIIFDSDLPLLVTKCETFGYADDFKLVATNSENMQYDIKQIEELGIGVKIVKFIASYLNKRTQYVKFKDFNSDTVQVTSGVPQGSLIGHCMTTRSLLLFFIFVNDLPVLVIKCEAFGYADDFKQVATNSENMQYDIQQIEEWCLNNKMTLNENQCYILPIKSQDHSKLSINNKTLLYQSEQKDLDSTMAPKLIWKPNVKKRCSKAQKAFYFLKKHLYVHKTKRKTQCVRRICRTNCYICNSSLFR